MRMFQLAVLAGALSVSACAPAISGSGDNITRLERTTAANPKSQAALRNLGIAYYKATPPRHQEARTALAKAVEMDPKDGLAALYLGLTAEAQNDFGAARRAYESYLASGRSRGAKNDIRNRLALLTRRENEENAKAMVAQEIARGQVSGPSTTVAVMPFIFTGADSLKPLERGMAELVVTDLTRSRRLTVVERIQLQALLDEMRRQNKLGVQAGSGVQVGKILQAGSIVGGQISQLGANQLNTSANVTSVRTSQAVGRGFIGQTSIDEIFNVEKSIVRQVFTDLGVQLTTAELNAIEERPTRSLSAFLAYSRGLELEDQGRYDAASREYQNALRIDPNFGSARQKSQETANVVAGATVTSTTVESKLTGTEKASVDGAQSGVVSNGTTAVSAIGVANGLNPSTANGATQGTASGAVQPTQVSNPQASQAPVTAKVTIVIKQPTP